MSDSKKAFDTAHTSVPVFYPDELALVGGADHLTDPREKGPLDTKAPKDQDPLYRPRRLTRPFKIGFVESIDANGVMEDIAVIMRDGVPVVEYGQMRTRAARVVNHERKKRSGCEKLSDRKAAPKCLGAGFPLVSLRAHGKKSRSNITTLGRILSENHQRHDDDTETSLDLMAQLLDATENNVELVAQNMGLSHQQVRHLMKYQENATKETRAAVAREKITLTAAALLAREADPEKQNKILADLLQGKDQTVRRAAALSSRRRKDNKPNPLAKKRSLLKFKEFVSQERDSEGFYDGVLALLDLQTSGKTEDERLAKLIERFGV